MDGTQCGVRRHNIYNIQIVSLLPSGSFGVISLAVHYSADRIPSPMNHIQGCDRNQQASIEEGDKLFGTECAACHGLDGHKPTDAGRWMYPRAADLTPPKVQQYSDRELFWIIKNGIRLSGMPAFGRVESDEHIWNLAHYVRTLRESGLSAFRTCRSDCWSSKPDEDDDLWPRFHRRRPRTDVLETLPLMAQTAPKIMPLDKMPAIET